MNLSFCFSFILYIFCAVSSLHFLCCCSIFLPFPLSDSISGPLEWCRTQSGCTVPSGIFQITKNQNHDIYQIRNQYRRPMNYHKKHNGFHGVLRIAQRNRTCPCPPVRPHRLQSPAWYPPPSAPVCRNVLFPLYDISDYFACPNEKNVPTYRFFPRDTGTGSTG